MRFTDGYWEIRPEYAMTYATEFARAEHRGKELCVMAASRPIPQRGSVLSNATINVRFFTPMPDVVGVEVVHFKGVGTKGPDFELCSLPVEPTVTEDEAGVSFTSGRLTARANKLGAWRVDFLADGKQVTSSGFHGMGRALDKRTGLSYMSDSLSLGVGECVYGLGERFAAYVKNGQQIDIWNADGGTCSEQAYKCVPFYMTNRGYGVFVDDTSDVSFEVASEKVERVQFSTSGERLRYFVIYGPDPKQVLERYTALTGRPALPPAWSFGLWLSTSFTTNYDEATTSSFIQGMADRDIPLSVFHFDCFWMKAFRWCDFEWDGAVFTDPEGMLRRYKARGLRICVWMNPYIAQDSPLFDEGLKGGYFIQKENGDPWQTDMWQAGMAILDVTNPAARDWYCSYLKRLMDMGVDCFKTDFGERIPVRGVKYFDGSDPLRMHNYYTHLYNRMVFELLERHRGVGEAVLFARSGTAGGQQYPVHWGGDNSASYPSMAETLRGGLSLAHSGFGFWSHDISGFEQTAPADVYKRWVAFGLLSSHSRLHGSSSYRVPWLFDEESVDVARRFAKLKNTLMPYLYGAAVEAHTRGTPMLRPMTLEFPDDPGCDNLDRQYMLGERLLVAPVFSESGVVDYYLPAGLWTHLLTGIVVEGGGWRRETHDYMSLPLMVRPNTVLPVGAMDARPDYDYLNGLTLHLYQVEDGARIAVSVPSLNGQVAAEFSVSRQGRTIHLKTDTQTPYKVFLHGMPSMDGSENMIHTLPGGTADIEI